LILDEPTVGLDPISTTVFKDKVRREQEAGRTVLLSSHLVNEVDELADHIVYLLDGKPFFDGSVQQLKQMAGETRLDRAIVRIMEGADEPARQ
jgi:Cu-processing system ATP-binding protein